MRIIIVLLFLTSASFSQGFQAGQPVMEEPVNAGQHAPPPVIAKPKPVKKKVLVEKKADVPPDPNPSFSPQSEEFLLKAIARYRAMQPWEILKPNSPKGMIEARLQATNDESVKAFQRRHGLEETGVVGVQTLKAMNVPLEKRVEALEYSLNRLRQFNFSFGERYVVVNIPSAEVEMIENGIVQRRHLAIVGKPDRATPQVETRLTVVNFNPTWTVPTSIIKKDMIPKMQKDPLALSKMRIKMLDREGNEVNPASIDWNTEKAVNYTLRQDAGASNSLGQIRVDMPNTEAVFMHDTPSKRLFKGTQRFHSSGCVRVEHVRDFASWLLKPQGYDRDKIDDTLKFTARKDVRLTKAVPVAWVYMTGWAESDGRVHFRDDIYGFDTPQALDVKIARAPQRRQTAPIEEAAPAPPPVEERSFFDIFFKRG
jgi:L,D-transpeptidase YcbB